MIKTITKFTCCTYNLTKNEHSNKKKLTVDNGLYSSLTEYILKREHSNKWTHVFWVPDRYSFNIKKLFMLSKPYLSYFVWVVKMCILYNNDDVFHVLWMNTMIVLSVEVRRNRYTMSNVLNYKGILFIFGKYSVNVHLICYIVSNCYGTSIQDNNLWYDNRGNYFIGGKM